MQTIAEMNRRTGIPIPTIRSAIREKRLPAQKLGRDWLIDESEQGYINFVKNHKPRQPKGEN
jgi:excisionase family DNA binding protein